MPRTLIDSPPDGIYASAMEQGAPFIRLTLDVKAPIELGEFVGAFTALGAEYDRFLKRETDGSLGATLFVRQVTRGSVIADIITIARDIGQVVSAARTCIDFVQTYGQRLGIYKRPGGRAEDATKSELRDFAQQVAAVAAVPGSQLRVAAVEMQRGEEVVRAAFQFDTSEAREIRDRVEEHKRELDHVGRSDKERVLMVFTRSDVGSAPLGQRSGERVVIESISPVPRPLIYASELAEQKIKHEITDEPDNVYRKGFVVDVNVETRNGKPAAYSVTGLHQVIELED